MIVTIVYIVNKNKPYNNQQTLYNNNIDQHQQMVNRMQNEEQLRQFQMQQQLFMDQMQQQEINMQI
jgi:5-formaminoimidazole-4-carboxamide-1-beta-D-ribofuranosyl 5'-monophosphate synthetase